ncbi:MAG: hypothetical protein AMXMBFR84_09160 [Candidatus Hydrogenedentota bacterium]
MSTSLNTYETLYIVRPDKSDEEVQKIAKQTEDFVTGNGGAILKAEIWGKRKLAYEVKQFNEGFYILLRFTLNPLLIEKLETTFRLSEDVIRDLILVFDEKTLRLEQEQFERVQAELQSGRRRSEDGDDEDDEPVMSRGPRGRHRDDDDD